MKLYVKDLLSVAPVLDKTLKELPADSFISFEENGTVFSTQPVENGTNVMLIAAKLKHPELFTKD
ncbi:hypothetical protein [Vibrio fluvialis]|uniref:hypothetical protein n=1 Tax=Vibrio fluvialis TaxID=676 RepID=UPI001BB00C38|nr:hypothetical protein [Vibrio fluvialis]QUF70045.1 hypothetical protein KC397_06535 [Vibrio fluvialis]